jgi:hypothetical protein
MTNKKPKEKNKDIFRIPANFTLKQQIPFHKLLITLHKMEEHKWQIPFHEELH